jgi:hypothetical protein
MKPPAYDGSDEEVIACVRELAAERAAPEWQFHSDGGFLAALLRPGLPPSLSELRRDKSAGRLKLAKGAKRGQVGPCHLAFWLCLFLIRMSRDFRSAFTGWC